VKESEEITSFYLVPEDGAPLLDFQPGQYIGMRLTLNGEEVRRNYSLSARANGHNYRISVKREHNGRVSNHLHNDVKEGDRLELFPPAGAFTLKPSQKPLVFISAGVGITPTLAMLEAALETSRPITFIHCARDGSVQAFRNWLEEQAAVHPHLSCYFCYSTPRPEDHGNATGLLTQSLLGQWLPANCDLDAYFLGPKPFMAMVKRELNALGVPETQSHYEFFGPAASLDA
jgi:nitric oxide dioxygenase